ncbi:TPA: hypothetical protein IGN17_002522 [Escherichia coli]|nr:hypothetical protein [Escherichia coli]
MDNSSVFLLVILVAIAVLVRMKSRNKKKKDDDFLNSVNYSHRMPAVKSKPKKGKRRSREEVLADEVAYQKKLGDDFRKKAKATQIQAERVGSSGYIWQGSDCCPACDKQVGKKFMWSKPPKTGHPGEGKLCPNGYCRCWSEVIVPRPRSR